MLKEKPEEFIARYFPDSGLGVPEHSFRDTVLDEFLAVANDGLDDPSRIFEQLNHYAVTDPESLDESLIGRAFCCATTGILQYVICSIFGGRTFSDIHSATSFR